MVKFKVTITAHRDLGMLLPYLVLPLRLSKPHCHSRSLFCLFCPLSPTRRVTRQNCWHKGKDQREEQFTGSISEIRKITVATTVLITRIYKKREHFTCKNAHQRVQQNEQWSTGFSPYHAFIPPQKDTPPSQKREIDSLFPASGRDIKQYWITRYLPTLPPDDMGHNQALVTRCSYYRFWISSLQQCHTHKKYKIISYWVNSLPTTFKKKIYF